MTRPRLFAAGAAHLDRRGHIAGVYVPGASNPGTMREEVGGGAFNALRNATRHGIDATIMSLRGGDTAGEAVARAIAEAGCADLSAVFLDRTTPSYTALLDRQGDLIAGFADMELYETGFERQMRRRGIRDAILAADAVLCDANLPAPALSRLAGLAAGKPIFAVAISPAKVGRLSGVLGSLACLFMNMREARVLADSDAASPVETARRLREKGLTQAAITAGGEAVIGFDHVGIFTLSPPPAETVADVTGAGDALAGTTLACMLRGMSLREAVRHGVAAAVLTVERPAVVAHYGQSEFQEKLGLVGSAEPVA